MNLERRAALVLANAAFAINTIVSPGLVKAQSPVESGSFGFNLDDPCTLQVESIPVTGTYRRVNGVLYVEPLRGPEINAVVVYHPTTGGTDIENIINRRGQVSRLSYLMDSGGNATITQNICVGAR